MMKTILICCARWRLFLADRELSRAVSSAFFSVIVEELCDDYEEFQFEVYNRVMSQVISYCRNIPAGKKIDRVSE